MALGRGDREQQLTASIAKLRIAVDDEHKKADQFRAMAASVDARLDEVAQLEAEGKIAEAEIEKRLAAIEDDRQRQLLSADQRDRVASLRQAELEQLERELGELPFRALLSQLPAVIAAQEGRAGLFAKSLRALERHAEQLEAGRAATKTLRADLARQRPEWVTDPIDDASEEDWSAETAALISFLQGGAYAPAASAERKASQAGAEQERSHREVVASYVAQFGGRLIGEEKLRAALQLEGALLERTVAAVKAEWEKRLAEQTPERRAKLLEERAELDARGAEQLVAR